MLVGLASPAWGWETDQLTDRGVPLQDATGPANTRLNGMLDVAAVRASARLSPHARPAKVERVVARTVWRVTANRSRVPGRGLFRGLGYGALAAWLETADIPRRSFLDRSDLYAGIPFGVAPILASAGTCSTVKLGGVLMGTDKVDHFLSTGWRYWNRARRGTLDTSIRYGTRTERTYLGLATSDTFSFADLHANWQGYQFYSSLLDPDRGLFTADGGRVERVRDFDWADWTDWRWDELLDPSVYTPGVQRWLDAHLPARMDALCTDAPAWAAQVASAHATIATEPAPWVNHRAPARSDPFGVPARCPDVSLDEASLDLTPAP